MIELSSSQLFYGDGKQLLKQLPDQSFRLVLTDPPYNVSRDNNLSTMNRRSIDFGEWDKNFDQLDWLEELPRLLQPSGSVVIWNDWKNLGAIAARLEQLGFDIKTSITWLKSNPVPRNMKRRFLQATEHGFWAVKKSRQKWIFNIGDLKNYESGVFVYPRQSDSHPNKKPNMLFKELIETLSLKNEWVLDPFCGSGTTCYAAELSGRNFIASENIKPYYEQALSLWNSAK